MTKRLLERKTFPNRGPFAVITLLGFTPFGNDALVRPVIDQVVAPVRLHDILIERPAVVGTSKGIRFGRPNPFCHVACLLSSWLDSKCIHAGRGRARGVGPPGVTSDAGLIGWSSLIKQPPIA